MVKGHMSALGAEDAGREDVWLGSKIVKFPRPDPDFQIAILTKDGSASGLVRLLVKRGAWGVVLYPW
jgi:hypothetical protein